jgi:hypothetical protein
LELDALTEAAPGWRRLKDRLHEIRELDENWDGLRGRAPRSDAVDSIFALLQILQDSDEMPTRIAPSPDGAVIIEWQNAGGYASLEVEAPFVGQFMLEQPGQPTIHNEWNWQSTWRAPAFVNFRA